MVVAAVIVASCSYPRPANIGDDDAAVRDASDTDADPDAPTQMDAAVDAAPPPPVPSYGAQIDRIGRPLINNALNNTFNSNATTTNTERTQYNANGTVSTWQSNYFAAFASSLAVYDALDSAGTDQCGDQFLYNANASGGGNPAAGSYASFAQMLADDRLYVDTSKSSCAFYLAVEFGVALGAGNTQCGGRAPDVDVVDMTYTLFIFGITGISGGVPLFGDNAAAHGNLLTAFPFLGAP